MNRLIKQYEIGRVLGEGAMGSVYYAVDTELGREVALKCLRSEVARRAGVADRFKREAQAQAKLNHPNIAHLWQYFQDGNDVYIAMEFVDGPSLARLLEQKGRLPYEDAVRYAVQALRGLAHAHEHQVIHRDIKPANLMINRSDQVKVTDFGIARLAGMRPTRDGMVIGTYEYISPEGAQGHNTTAFSDLYSLGVVMFEMITGRLPFESDKEFELLRMHIEAGRPSIRTFVTDVPTDLDGIVRQAMDRSAHKRFESADAMADALIRCMDRRRSKQPQPKQPWWRVWSKDAKEDILANVPSTTEQRRNHVSTASRKVEDLLEKHLWGEADFVLDQCLREYPGDADLLDLRNRVQRQRQISEQSVAQQVQIIRGLLERDPQVALTAAEGALKLFPGEAALLELERECKRRLDAANASARELEQVQQEVNALIAEGQFKDAKDHVLQLMERHPAKTELGMILSRIVREESVREVLKKARGEAAAARWEQALNALDGALERFPGDASLAGLRNELQAQWVEYRRQEEIRELLGRVRRLEASESADAARELLAEEMGALGQDPALAAELDRIEKAIQAARREERIRSVLAEASDFHAKRQWPKALELLEKAVAEEGQDERLEELQTAVAAENHAYQARLLRVIADSRALIRNAKWEEAERSLTAAVGDFPGEATVEELLQEARRGLAERVRQEVIDGAVTKAAEQIAALDFQAAIDSLTAALRRYPEDAGLKAAHSESIRKRDAYLLEQKISAAIRDAAACHELGDLETALKLLQDAIRAAPDHKVLRETAAAYAAERREKERREGLASISAALEDCKEAEDYSAQIIAIAQMLVVWPSDPEVRELERRIRAGQRAAQCKAAIRDVVEVGGELERGGRWTQAAVEYAEILARFPESESALAAKAENARVRAAEIRRTALLAKLDSSLPGWLEAGRFDEVERDLREFDRQFPNDSALTPWRHRLAEARRENERRVAIRIATERAKNLLLRQAFDAAEDVLREAERQTGPDESLHSLLEAAGRAREEHKGGVDSAVRQVMQLFESGIWVAAASSAEAAAARFPSEPRFVALLEDARRNAQTEVRAKPVASEPKPQAPRPLPPTAGDPTTAILPIKPGAAEDREAGFRKAAREAARLRRTHNWGAARPGLTPYLSYQETSARASQLLAELEADEIEYRRRSAAVEIQARSLIQQKRYSEAVKALEDAVHDLGDVPALGPLLNEARRNHAVTSRAARLDELDQSIRSLWESNFAEDALAAADSALLEFPDEASVKNLRSLIASSVEKQTAIRALAHEVRRLADAGLATAADRLLVSGLREFRRPKELKDLRPVVDAARKAEWERESHSAERTTSLTAIEALLDASKTREAVQAFEAFETQFGAAPPTVADRVAAAARAHETEVERALAETERLRKLESAQSALQYLGLLSQPTAQDPRIEAIRQSIRQEMEIASQITMSRGELRPPVNGESALSAQIERAVLEAERLRRARKWERAGILLDQLPPACSLDRRVTACRVAIDRDQARA